MTFCLEQVSLEGPFCGEPSPLEVEVNFKGRDAYPNIAESTEGVACAATFDDCTAIGLDVLADSGEVILRSGSHVSVFRIAGRQYVMDQIDQGCVTMERILDGSGQSTAKVTWSVWYP